MNLNAALTRLSQDPTASFDLAELALLLARDEFPTLDVDGYLAELDAMAHEVRRGLRGGLPRQVEWLCRYLFRDLGFRGNTDNYYDPRNSYFHQVLDRRLGIPISLSTVAMTVGKRAGMDVFGVALPGHFIVKAVSGSCEILFDPFHEGRQMSVSQCEELVEEVTGLAFEPTAEDFRSASLGSVVTRMLTNLKAIYLGSGDFGRAVKVLQRLRQLQPDDPYQQRDLGVSLLHAGRPGPAIDHLETFLSLSKKKDESEAVQLLLKRARAEVSRWN